jgi:hypothetical protein
MTVMLRRCVQCWVCFLPLLGSYKGAAEGRLRRGQYAVRYAGRSDVAEVRSVLNAFLHFNQATGAVKL